MSNDSIIGECCGCGGCFEGGWEDILPTKDDIYIPTGIDPHTTVDGGTQI